ncbi:MAG: carboxypeptidase regulatory-like domain-containing protein [Vulcanimicrobiaceae bacterium]
MLLAMVLSMATPSFAAGGQTGGLSGTVTDSDTRAAVAGASVTVASPTGTFKTKTDGTGFFSILGMPVDTYTLSIESQGYQAVTQTGVTLTGDQTTGLGQVRLLKELRTIARTTARSTTGAFQPTQTIDSYTIAGNRILQTTGKAATTNENNLLLAVPGVTLTNEGEPTIRGGAAREVGYQYDGVSFVEPFLGNNGSSTGAGAGLFNGIGNVQVVEGAGDATQGNVGSGVINVIPKRGTYPGFGFVDFEAGGPNYFHQFAFEYGIATKDNSISDYIAYNGQRFNPYHGYTFTSAGPHLNYFDTSYQLNDQFTNNFVFKFGRNKTQSLQVLYTNVSLQQLGNLGGIPGGVFNPVTNPNALVYYPYDQLSQQLFYTLSGLSPSQYASLVGLGPGVPSTNVAITQPQQNQSLQTRFLKFEYDNNLSADTFLALRYYNWEQLDYTDNQYSLGPTQGGITDAGETGGPIVGTSLDFTHQFGSKLTVSINGKYENEHPVWDSYEPQLYFFGGLSAPAGPGSGPTVSDWLPGGYVYDYFTTRGLAVPRIPSWGINYQGAFFQNWGTGLRLQYNPTSRIKTDLGVRYEGQNQHWFNQLNQYGLNIPGNPFSVVPSSWTNSVLNPTEIEPRAGITYLMGVNDSLRAGYGRSAVFLNGQTAGTPFNAYGLAPYMSIPALPGFSCGIQIKYVCRSYGEQLYWQGDAVEAPDAGNGEPAIYTNYDLTYQHQFKNGWGARLTPFYKLGTNLPAFSLLAVLPGGNEIFGAGNQGLNRTTGLEFNLTTPDKPFGLSGFLSATYQNVLSTTPPLSINETAAPLLSPATLALGDIYRAGYVSPFSMRIGGTWALKDGLRITPDLQYNIGYPYSAGNLIANAIGVDAAGNTIYANVPQVNFGAGVQQLNGIQNVNGTNLSTNYYDPAFPGTSTNPNVVATRGTSATSANGGILSPANLEADLTIEYKRAGNTFGVQLLNLFGNAFVNTVPAINPYYQPAANGLSGPRTGINGCATTYGTARGCSNIPSDIYAFSNGAYLLSNGDFTGTTELAPLRPFTIQLYYQRQL